MAMITITLATRNENNAFNVKELAIPKNVINADIFAKNITNYAHYYILDGLYTKLASIQDTIDAYDNGDNVSLDERKNAVTEYEELESLIYDYKIATDEQRAFEPCNDLFILACLSLAKIGVKFNFTHGSKGVGVLATNYYNALDTNDDDARKLFKVAVENIAKYYLSVNNADGIYKNITPRVNNATLKDIVAICKKSPVWNKKGIKGAQGLTVKDNIVTTTIIAVVLANTFEFDGTTKKSNKNYSVNI